MENSKKYIVVENPNYYDGERWFIYEEENFSYMNLCDCYLNGGKMCHAEVCGLDVDCNGDELPEDEQTHVEVYAHTWWDGSNWRSTIIGSSDDGDDSRYDGEEASHMVSTPIIANLPPYPYMDSEYMDIESGGYVYHFTRWATGYVCSVDYIGSRG